MRSRCIWSLFPAATSAFIFQASVYVILQPNMSSYVMLIQSLFTVYVRFLLPTYLWGTYVRHLIGTALPPSRHPDQPLQSLYSFLLIFSGVPSVRGILRTHQPEYLHMTYPMLFFTSSGLYPLDLFQRREGGYVPSAFEYPKIHTQRFLSSNPFWLIVIDIDTRRYSFDSDRMLQRVSRWSFLSTWNRLFACL